MTMIRTPNISVRFQDSTLGMRPCLYPAMRGIDSYRLVGNDTLYRRVLSGGRRGFITRGRLSRLAKSIKYLECDSRPIPAATIVDVYHGCRGHLSERDTGRLLMELMTVDRSKHIRNYHAEATLRFAPKALEMGYSSQRIIDRVGKIINLGHMTNKDEILRHSLRGQWESGKRD